MKGSMSAQREIQVPPIFQESFQRRQGLVLFAGLREAGVENTVSSVTRLLGNRESLLWNSAKDRDRAKPNALLVVHAGAESPSVEEILQEAESGRLVVWILQAPGPLVALRRILSQSFGEGRSHILWRMSEQLILAAGQMRLASTVPGEAVDAYEILLMTPILREALAKEDFETIEESLRNTEEGSGVVSFNQSMLQLLLRRTIDIKTAFEATRDPVNLDQILKKVGI